MDELSAREIIGISKGPFSGRTLKKAFRRKSFECHPDQGGSDEAFLVLQNAYKFLLKNTVVDSSDDVSSLRTVNGVFLSELGKGYPLTTSACSCERCDGRGFVSFNRAGGMNVVDCDRCSGSGFHFHKCNRCGGSGDYKRSGKVVGHCFSCDGTGRFYPKRKGPFSMWMPWVVINEKRFNVYNCHDCKGLKTKASFRKTNEKLYRVCSECEGVGETIVWNPVIPRGFFCK
jgi:DnaJ-class molecular chaperone